MLLFHVALSLTYNNKSLSALFHSLLGLRARPNLAGAYETVRVRAGVLYLVVGR